MEVLKDISKISSFRPQSGLKKELFHLVVTKNWSRKEAQSHFEKKGKEGQFLVVYKRLKEDLLEGITDNSLNQLPKVIKTRFKIWKKHLQAKILMYSGRRIAAVKLATEAMTLAERYSQFEAIQSLSYMLINYYATTNPDVSKFKKYQQKLLYAREAIAQETDIAMVLFEMALYHYKGHKVVIDTSIIEKFDKINETNEHVNFKNYYFLLKSLYYQLQNKPDKIIENNKAAHHFFTTTNKPTTYFPKFSFLSDLIPIYIIRKEFAKAESYLNRCLVLPPEGNFNYHKTLIYQALLGFYSQKPKMALHAYKASQIAPRNFDSTIIDQWWHLIKGYLSLYDKLGLVYLNEPFRLLKYMNIQERQGDNNQKANLIILELLHLLLDKNYARYLDRTERVESFISSRFKKPFYKRTRYFLRMLKAIVKGNYHTKLTTAHAKKQLTHLVQTQKAFDLGTTEREIVPYEILWDLVLKQLR